MTTQTAATGESAGVDGSAGVDEGSPVEEAGDRRSSPAESAAGVAGGRGLASRGVGAVSVGAASVGAAGWLWPVSLLTLALLLPLPFFLWYGFARHGAAGLAAAAVAGVVCWLGAAGALVVASILRGNERSLHALLLGMMMRMGLPLGVVAWLVMGSHWLARSGGVGMILVYYLISLVVETGLSLRLVGRSRVDGGLGRPAGESSAPETSAQETKVS